MGSGEGVARAGGVVPVWGQSPSEIQTHMKYIIDRSIDVGLKMQV